MMRRALALAVLSLIVRGVAAEEPRQFRVITHAEPFDSLTIGSQTSVTSKASLLGSRPWGWAGVLFYIDNYDTAGLAGIRLDSRGDSVARGGGLYHVGANAGRDGAYGTNNTVLIAYESALSLIALNGGNGSIRFYTGHDDPAFERMRITGDGKIGLGTATPFYPVDVSAPSYPNLFPNTPVTMGVFDETPWSADRATGAGIGFGGYYNPTESTTWAVISGIRENATYGNYAGALTFGTRPQGNGGTSIERMRLTSAGELMIGKPGETGQKLTVYGDAVIEGNIGAKYQDVAEWVPSTEDLTPGTVVVLDPSFANRIMPSAKAYDTTVAGVVSAQPGVILGIPAPDKEQVATTGRVMVKVDATQRPIAIGDLLVTGPKPGTAIASQPVNAGGVSMHRPGTILGKALQPLAAGEGEILVLLSIQ